MTNGNKSAAGGVWCIFVANVRICTLMSITDCGLQDLDHFYGDNNTQFHTLQKTISIELSG